MPIHDWTRVSAGNWHDFHSAWLTEIRNVLNTDLLPDDYYALAEQIVGPLGPDVLTLQSVGKPETETEETGPKNGNVAIETSQPRTRITADAEMDEYVLKRRTLVIRHATGDRIVALLEVLSPGNKSSRHALRSFVDKAIESLYRGYHLLLIDLFPPGARDPNGIHGVIWSEFSDEHFELPAGEPLTLAAYSAGQRKRAFVEPTAVGHNLIDMPLFLQPDQYVNVPLEATYSAAYRGVPKKWQRVLESTDQDAHDQGAN